MNLDIGENNVPSSGMLAIENQRLRQVREEAHITQAEMGRLLELPGSTADLERGRMRIPGRSVMLLHKRFGINPQWLYGESKEKYLRKLQAHTLPQTVVVDASDREHIVLVPEKAAAGYGQNLGDPEYVARLNSFYLPLPQYRNRSYRGFEIAGDSMLPLVQAGDWVLTQAVEQIEDVRSGEIYVVVEADSLRLKKVRRNGDRLDLISLNPKYPDQQVHLENVLELWQYRSLLSMRKEQYGWENEQLRQIQTELREIKQRLGENPSPF